MKIAIKAILAGLILLQFASTLLASGSVGIYGIVSKVVFEPNEGAPGRIQIWGAFILIDGGTGSGGRTLAPQRGYLYFSLPASDNPTQREAALKEWSDFKAIAGTGQAVAFGRFGYFGAFSDELISRNGLRSGFPVRGESVPTSAPDAYPLNMGLTKLSSTGDLAAVVKQLQQTLKP